MHFAFVVMLRAIRKASPELYKYDTSLGNRTEGQCCCMPTAPPWCGAWLGPLPLFPRPAMQRHCTDATTQTLAVCWPYAGTVRQPCALQWRYADAGRPLNMRRPCADLMQCNAMALHRRDDADADAPAAGHTHPNVVH